MKFTQVSIFFNIEKIVNIMITKLYEHVYVYMYEM